MVREGEIHEPFQRVPIFTGDVDLAGGSGMVARVAREDQVQLAIVQREVDPGHQQILRVPQRFRRRHRVVLRGLLVQLVGDKVAQQRPHHGVELDVLLEQAREALVALEEFRRPLFGDFGRVGVQAMNG